VNFPQRNCPHECVSSHQKKRKKKKREREEKEEEEEAHPLGRK